MSILTQAQGTKTAITIASVIASGAYVVSSAIDLSAVIPLDLSVELEILPTGTPTGNAQCVLFAQLSLDGTNYGTPSSGYAAANENQMHYVGRLPCAGATVLSRKAFSMAALPVARYVRFVVKDDMGIAATGLALSYATITGVST